MRLGSDPEVLLVNKTGKHISAIGYINADKWNPMQIPDMPQGFTLQEDNVALEYGIPPASSASELVASLQSVMARSLEYLPNLDFSSLSCTVFDEDQMEHPRAHIFGCEPDFNAWTNSVNVFKSPSEKFMRSAGGHIHVETDANPLAVVRAMDLFLGVPSTLMDKGVLRRQMYGKAGAHRVKSYGVEYRTLSNFWVFDEKLIHWVWTQTERALANLGVAEHHEEDILRAINENDAFSAYRLIEQHHLEVV